MKIYIFHVLKRDFELLPNSESKIIVNIFFLKIIILEKDAFGN